MTEDHLPALVSIVMPVWNEAAYLERSLAAIDDQTYPPDRLEIIVVDGGSSDGTVRIAAAHAAVDTRIQVLGGAGVNTPTAMNVGAEAARGTYVAKVDGHGWISPTFIADAVAILDADDSIGCVGGRIVPVARTSTQRANQIARFSRLGVGVGIYTASERVQDIDTVQCGVYRGSTLSAIGGFDPELQFGEDEELNHRLRATGARIVYQPSMRFHYEVRPSLRSLLSQYRNYGRARVAVVRKHPGFLRLKHTLPSALIVAMIASVVIGVLGLPIVPAIVIGGYVLVLLVGAVILSARARFRRPDLVALSLACLHLGYGSGMLAGILTARR